VVDEAEDEDSLLVVDAVVEDAVEVTFRPVVGAEEVVVGEEDGMYFWNIVMSCVCML
jgi:phosphoribosyl-ATP pyrophosphohydrolase